VSCAYPKKSDFFKPQTLSSGQATIYLYRADNGNTGRSEENPVVFINAKKIGNLKFGGYYYEYVTPGEVEVSFYKPIFGVDLVTRPRLKFNLHVEAGKEYFVEYKIDEETKSPILKQTPNSLALPEIQHTQLLTFER
jgi:hypothetical protein